MTRSRWSPARPDPSSQGTSEGFPELQQPGDELDERRTLTGLQELMVLSMLMFDRHHVEGVMRVFASSVRAVTGCELVEVRRRRGNTWISWPGPGSALPEPEPVTKPIVEPDGSHWRCTAAIAAFSGTPGRLVLRSATRPDAAQLFVIERLGHLLGAALMDAELHERDRRRAHELDQLNNQLARTIASLQQRQAVQEAFTNLTIKGSDEQELAAALGELTGRTVVVRDAFGHETTRVMGADQATGPSPIDESDRSSKVLRGSTSIATIGGRRDLGTIGFATPPAHDDEDAQFALRYASTALGLLKAHLQAVGEMENRLSRDLVEDLLDAAVTPEAAGARAAAQGHDLRAPHDVIVVAWPVPEPMSEGLHDHAINQVRQAMARQRRPCLVARRRGVIVILAHSGVDISALYNDLCRGLERPDGQVAIGEPALTPQQIPRAFAQARRALTARQQSSKPYGATAYADLGVTRILAIEENAAEVERLISDWLGGLLDYDKLHGTDLVPTLAAYLDRGGNYDETARALSVHRNTLRYRLARITKISGHDLTDVDTRLNLHLASRAWMERHQPPGQS